MKENHCVFTIFGATGDLTNRKLLPAFYFMEQERQLKDSFRIICAARKEKSDEQYRRQAADSVRKFSRVKVQEDVLKKLLSRISYHKLEFNQINGYSSLKSKIETVSGEKCKSCERIFYLAIPSSLMGAVVDNLKSAGLTERQE